MAQICSTSRILPLLHECGKINGLNVLMDLGVYDPDFLAIREDRGKRGKVCNTLVSFINLTVVNDHGSSDKISSIDSLLIPTLLCWDFQRVIPPRTRLLRLVQPSYRFLVNLSREGISVKRSTPGHSKRQIRGNNFPRTGWKSDLVQLKHNEIHLST
jgi:hypothetical protein